MSDLSIRAAALEQPEAIALIDGDRLWTWQQLANEVESVIDWLAEAKPGTGPIAVAGRGSLDSLLLAYAAFELGRTLVPLHPRWHEAERQQFLEDMALSDWLEAEDDGPARYRLSVLPEVLPEVLPTSLPEALPAPASEAAPQASSTTLWPACEALNGDERIAAVIATSGTSERPKGVALSRRAFLASAGGSAANLRWQTGDRWLLSLPIAHIGGLSILTRCLVARRTVVLPPPGASRFAASAVVAWCRRHEISLLSVVPTMLGRLLELEQPPPPSLRAVLVGGAAAGPKLLQRAARLGWPVLSTYGLTEACSQVATQAYERRGQGDIGCGALMPGVEARLSRGCLELRGTPIMSGYLPAERLGIGLNDGWLRTGDLACFDSPGHLHITGRADQVIITGGENVHPSEVEDALNSHPQVKTACVVGVAHSEWGQSVAAVIVARGELASGELTSWLRGRLATFKCPRQWLFLDALPTLPSGKPDRRRCESLFG